MRIFLTGAAGFIGYHLAKRLMQQGHHVFGYDSVNDYYDVRYKLNRLEDLSSNPLFSFTKDLLENSIGLKQAYEEAAPEVVINLAAQAGVRYSIENPQAYIQANVLGFQNVIELVRQHKPQNFIYASSSSVYGGNKEMPFNEGQDTSSPISLYAATKMSNELVAKCYSHLYGIPSIGLRFFTVYGPYSRPDMAMFKFADLIRKGKPIPVYNQGRMIRDWTFVGDIVDGIMAMIPNAKFGQIYNLGKGSPDQLSDMIALLEDYLGLKAQLEMLPMQAGDVAATHADVSKAQRDFGYQPKVTLAEGMQQFVDWYQTYHQKNQG